MHPPKYKALEESHFPLRRDWQRLPPALPRMYAMKDTSMAGCADAAYQLVVACGALQALAAVNSPHVGAVAKGVEQICKACQTECEKFPNVAECKACAKFCKACAAECAKAA